MRRRLFAGGIGILLAVVGLVPSGSSSAFASYALREIQMGQRKGVGLEELERELRGKPERKLLETAAGLEEKILPEDAKKILEEDYPGWVTLPAERQTDLIDQYVREFSVSYKEWKQMKTLLSKSDSQTHQYPLAEIPFPTMRDRTAEEIRRGKIILPQTVFLLGAGGAGGRLFREFDLLADLEWWDNLDSPRREQLLKDLGRLAANSVPKGPPLPTDPSQVTEGLRMEFHRWFTSRLISLFGLTEGERSLTELRARVERGELTKPTFPLSERDPSPLATWLTTIAKMDSGTVVIIGVAPSTERQIIRFLQDALGGAHGSSSGTFFGLKGPIGLLRDPVVPVIDARTNKLALDSSGFLYKGGSGGAGSLVALAQPIHLLKTDGQVETFSIVGFDWLEQNGKENLFIGDADTIGTTPRLIYDALGLIERHKSPTVAFAYPDPGEPRGILVNVVMDQGTSDERMVLINREPFERGTVQGMDEAIRTSQKEVPANSGIYLVKLETLKLLVNQGFPWHVSPARPAHEVGYDVRRFEGFKPDIYELIARYSVDSRGRKTPIYTPVVKIADGEVIPIKDPAAVEQARALYHRIKAGLEEKVVSDKDLARELEALVTGEVEKGIFPMLPASVNRLVLPQLGVWVEYLASRATTFQLPSDPPDASYCCRLDEQRLRHRGEDSFRWREWYVHGAFPIANGQASFVAVRHGIRPMDEAKLRDMVDLARLLPGYRMVENYSRQTPEGRIIHMGRSVPTHDHLNAFPLAFPVEELPPARWETRVMANGVSFKKSIGLPNRIRLFEGEQPGQVVEAAHRFVKLLDEAIQREPDRFQGYNTHVVFLNGRLQVYLIPRRAFSDPEWQPLDSRGDWMALNQFRALAPLIRRRLYYLPISTTAMMGGLHTPDLGTYLRLKKNPGRTAAVLPQLLDRLSTPEEALRPLDALWASGLEETADDVAVLSHVEEVDWLGLFARITGRIGEMDTDEVTAVVRQLNGMAVATSQVGVEIAMNAKLTSLEITDKAKREALAAAIQASRSNLPPATVQKEVTDFFLFDHPKTIPLAASAAQTGKAYVAILAETITQADGLRVLFQEAKIPADLYAIRSLEEFGGSREKGVEALRRRFDGAAEQRVPSTSLEEILVFLSRYGILIDTETAVGLEEKVGSYLGSLA